MAPLPQRARLLAFRLGASARILPEPLFPEPTQPAGVRALVPEVRALHYHLAKELAEPSAVYHVLDTTCWIPRVGYHVLDTTLIPAIVRVRASRTGLFCGQATFRRSTSTTEWVYGFKVAGSQ